MRWKTLRRRFRARILRLLLSMLAALPLSMLYRLAYVCAYLLYYLPTKTQQIATVNIQKCFPHLSADEQKKLLWRTLLHNTCTMLEMPYIWCRPATNSFVHIDTIENEETFRQAFEKKQQAILITPHLGCWELSGLYASSQYPMAIMYRPSRLQIDDIIISGREKCGASTVTADTKGVRQLMKALQQGKVLGILPDQDPGEGEGVFVDFFGHSTYTMTLVMRLAQKFELPVFLLTAERHLSSQTFTLRYIQLVKEHYQHTTIHDAVTYMNTVIEQEIHRIPEQYLWTYRRFKTRPDNAPSFY